MKSRHSSLQNMCAGWRMALLFLYMVSSMAGAVEPLAGPVVGTRRWRTTTADVNTYHVTDERFIQADIPIPVRAGMSMPFATLRYLDNIDDNSRTLARDQRLGIGFLHHSSEGDPAWRIDIARLGQFDAKPAAVTRLTANLLKPLPWLRLRPSDYARSWAGIYYVNRFSKAPLIIPEISWYRLGADGLLIDLQAPKQFLIGLENESLSFKFGTTQEWLNLTSKGIDSWILRRYASAIFSVNPTPKFTVTTSLHHDLKSTEFSDSIGAEISLRWNPGT